MRASDLYSFANLHRAYRVCRRTKRNSVNALAFEVDAEAKLLELQRELREHTYRPGTSICFVTEGPKPREVFAADFRDRIVHHVLVAYQARILEPRFIHDSYACRPGKGTLAASDRLMHLLRQITANGRRPAWTLKLDVASFFGSIDKEILFAILCRHIRDPEIRWLTRVVLFHDPTADYRFRPGVRRTPEPADPRYPVAPGKSLFARGNVHGLPIGNLTSQFWANVYLNELDQFAKRTLGCRHYARYVDDVVLLCADPQRLRDWRDAICRFLCDALRLELRGPLAQPFAVSRGIDFVGWRTWRTHRLVRRQTLANLEARLRGFARRRVQRAFAGEAVRVALIPAALVALRATLASYASHLRHGAAWDAWTRTWQSRPWLDAVFRRDAWRIRQRWRSPARPGLRFAYAAFLPHAPAGAFIFLPVGRFIEFFGPQRELAERVLGLRRVRLVWRPWALTAGCHRRWAGRIMLRALRHGHAVMLAGADGSGCDRRWRPRAVLVPRHGRVRAR